MTKRIKRGLLAGALMVMGSFGTASALTVPGTADLFFNGNDFTGKDGDEVEAWVHGSAPVVAGTFAPGSVLSITAGGTIDYSSGKVWGTTGPDGSGTPAWTEIGPGFKYGQLVGVFSSGGGYNPLGLPFIVGSHLAGFTVPDLAGGVPLTLYLGVADEGSWTDNTGEFNVTVVPLPGTLWLMGSGLLTLFVVRRARMQKRKGLDGRAEAVA